PALPRTCRGTPSRERTIEPRAFLPIGPVAPGPRREGRLGDSGGNHLPAPPTSLWIRPPRPEVHEYSRLRRPGRSVAAHANVPRRELAATELHCSSAPE